MGDQHLKEEFVSREQLYKGKFLHAVCDTVKLPDGQMATREHFIHSGAVVVIPLLPDGRIILERQYRYPVGQVVLEFPAGKLEPNENIQYCGQREFVEETGYRAAQWAYAGITHLAVAYSTEILHIYFAKDLVLGQRNLDEGEFIEVFSVSVDEAMAWAREGKITDAKTMTCLFYLQEVLSGRKSLKWVQSIEK